MSNDVANDLIESIADAEERLFMKYVYNRRAHPEVTPARWALIFEDAAAMEQRFQAEFVSSIDMLKELLAREFG